MHTSPFDGKQISPQHLSNTASVYFTEIVKIHDA